MLGRRMLAGIAIVAAAASLSANGAAGPPDASTPLAGTDAENDGGLQPAQRLTPPARRASFAFTGDILTHRPVNWAAQQPGGGYDYDPMFARIAPLLSFFDVPICHLEQPIAPPGTPVIVGPDIHSSAPEMGAALRTAGYRRCSTASNHSLDRGIAGIDATVGTLLAAGVDPAGMARSPAEAVPRLFDVNGITAVHLSYSFTLGGRLPSGESWRANVIDTGAIVAAARDARARGAELVIVSLHWGNSAQVAPSTYQRQVAQAITAPGDIDLIVGHHAHVLQPIEQVNGTWVAWGLGNLLSNLPVSFWPPSTQDGAVVTVTVTQAATGEVTVERPMVYPTWCDKDRGYVVRLTSDAADPTLPASVRQQLAISEARTRSVLGDFFAPGV